MLLVHYLLSTISSLQVCLVWNQMTTKQIQSLKQGQLSLALKLKRQHTAGLVGAISLYKSYSEGKLITKQNFFSPESLFRKFCLTMN